MKCSKHDLRKGEEEEEGNGKYNGGVNCTHVWTYHNETPSYY
jgi:hypothetical protein